MRPQTFGSTFPGPLLSEAGNRLRARPYITGAVAAATLLAVSAFVNHRLARKAESDNPPTGQFVNVDNVSIHYVERGEGEALILLHGNGSMIQDFQSSGLIDTAARNFRVIAFDRPGFGHSERPRTTVWTPRAQAELLHRAAKQLGVSRALVLGHSWGASVAVAMALEHPESVSGLILASGYYYPSARADVPALSAPAIPLAGDIIRYSISPIVSRLMWPLLLRKMFGPAPIPEKFGAFPKTLSFRPSQIRASAAESALMIPSAYAQRHRYRELRMPVAIIAGAGDRLIDIEHQSARLHADIPQSVLHRVAGSGHMVQQTATAAVMSAIDEVANMARPLAS